MTHDVSDFFHRCSGCRTSLEKRHECCSPPAEDPACSTGNNKTSENTATEGTSYSGEVLEYLTQRIVSRNDASKDERMDIVYPPVGHLHSRSDQIKNFIVFAQRFNSSLVIQNRREPPTKRRTRPRTKGRETRSNAEQLRPSRMIPAN